MNWKNLVVRGCGLVEVTYWYFHGGIEENLEGPQDVWHPAQDLN